VIRFGFYRKWRLQKRRDFLRVQRFGTRSFGKYVVVIAMRCQSLAPNNISKAGITVSKKVGPAHLRNKIKRRLRHVLRTHSFIFSKKLIVVIAKDSAKEATFVELKDDLLRAFLKFADHPFDKTKISNEYYSA
jgi:ribonuclease P protein component